MPSTAISDSLQPAGAPAETGPKIELRTDSVSIPVKLCNLPPLNAVASQVLSLTADPNVELYQISRVIEGDPAFAADILMLANSPLFGFPSRMQVLRHAIALLGIERVKALAVTVAMRGFLGKRSPLGHQCWQHSVACALVSEEISAIFNLPGGQAYTAGIMHDIGRLGLLQAYPKEMAAVLSAQYEDACDILLAEQEALKVDHARAGAWLAGTWGLPEVFSEICAHHHGAPSVGDSEVLELVRAACSIADAIGFPAAQGQQLPAYAEAAAPLAPRLRGATLRPAEDLLARVTARLKSFES
jgi:HD-like signal output (HDOD) protein